MIQRVVKVSAVVMSMAAILVMSGMAYANCPVDCPNCQYVRDLLRGASSSRIDANAAVSWSSTSCTPGYTCDQLRVVADVTLDWTHVWSMNNEQNNQWIVSVSGGTQLSPGTWRIYGYHRARFLCTSGSMSQLLHSTSDNETVRSELSRATGDHESLADFHFHPETIRLIGRQGEAAMADHYASVISLGDQYRHVPYWDTLPRLDEIHTTFHSLMVPTESPYVDLGDMQAVLFLSSDESLAKMVSRKGNGYYQEITIEIGGPGFTGLTIIDVTYHSQPEKRGPAPPDET